MGTWLKDQKDLDLSFSLPYIGHGVLGKISAFSSPCLYICAIVAQRRNN